MKKSKVKYDGIRIAVMPMIGLGMSGHNPWRYAIAHHKFRARMTLPKASEHLEIAKKHTARQWEIINMLVDRGLDFPEACEAARNCDDEPVWL
jgi:hypothetical protein